MQSVSSFCIRTYTFLANSLSLGFFIDPKNSMYAPKFGLTNWSWTLNLLRLESLCMYLNALYLPIDLHSSMAIDIEYASISSGSSK